MKFFVSDFLLDTIPMADWKSDIIYLKPRGLCYSFSKPIGKFVYTVRTPNTHNILKIRNENDMVSFIKHFGVCVETDYGLDGRVSWSDVRNQFDGVEFRWWRPMWECSPEFQELLLEKSAWEWFSSFERPCGFIWNMSGVKLLIKFRITTSQRRTLGVAN